MSGTSFTVEEATIDGIHAAMLAGELRCSALVEAYLQRIDAFDRNGPKLNTIVSLSDQAQRRAGELDAELAATGRLSGPLHGIPVLVKDCIETADTPTTFGSIATPRYLAHADAEVVRRYGEVFGAQPRGELYVNSDGTIGHAEVSIGNAVLMFSEASDLWPDVPVRAPESPATFSHTLQLEVDDVDGSTERARRAGASVEREPTDQPYGRGAVIVDPFGHRWMLLRPPAQGSALLQGDVANVTMTARDAQRAKEFYEAVLQIQFAAAHPGTWRAAQTMPPLGIRPSQGAEPEVQLSFRIDDIAAAVERVRAAGGRADEPVRGPYGLHAECVDDQGVTFRLWQPGD